jgi:hypothetical protein
MSNEDGGGGGGGGGKIYTCKILDSNDAIL